MTAADLCPCGSDVVYSACCGRYHAGDNAPTAEALMRSRYSAFARRDAAYLIRTTTPLARAKLRPADFRDSFALTWTRLEVLAVDGGGIDDVVGFVRFRARFRETSGEQVLEERSRFTRDGTAWVYNDGIVVESRA